MTGECLSFARHLKQIKYIASRFGHHSYSAVVMCFRMQVPMLKVPMIPECIPQGIIWVWVFLFAGPF